SFLPVNGPLHLGLPDDELAGDANHRQEGEQIRNLHAREIAFQNGFLHQVVTRMHRGTTSRINATARSISADVVKRLREMRTVLRASSSESPIALRMRLGSTRPDEPADPVDPGTPFSSRPVTVPSPSAPWH